MFPSDKKSGYIQAVGYIYVGFGFLLFYCRDTTDLLHDGNLFYPEPDKMTTKNKRK